MSPRTRLLAVAGAMLAFSAVGWAAGAGEHLTPTALQGWFSGAGIPGMFAFVALFALGNLVSVPGLVFVFAALLAYGPLTGAMVALVGSLAAVSLNYWVVRRIGGPSAAKLDNRLVNWAMGHVERKPLLATATLRALTVLSPPVNIALALSPIRYRDYVVGSAAGLLIPIGVYAIFFDCLVGKFLA